MKIDEKQIGILGKEVFLYGAGRFSQISVIQLWNRGISIKGILVSSTNENALSVFGIPVFDVHNESIDRNTKVIIATAENKHKEIEEILYSEGYTQVYSVHDNVLKAWENSKSQIEMSNFEIARKTRYYGTYEKVLDSWLKGDLISKDRYYQLAEEFRTAPCCIPRLVVVLGTKCSLKCKDCNNLIPYFENPKDVETAQILDSLDMILSKTTRILSCELIGGEPFISNNLRPVLEKLILTDKVERIEITTNGTKYPNSDIRLLLKNNKVVVKISEYNHVIDIRPIISFCEEERIKYDVLKMDSWILPGGYDKRHKNELQLKENYYYCTSGYMCKALLGNRIHMCARGASLFELGKMKESEGLIIDSSLTEEAIRQFWEKEYAYACDYCDYGNIDKEYIEPALQLVKR